jgi:2-polyprenyl-6-methoxyphenol hydroxylase-like FAD-dependent oxidoreductase
MSDEPSTSELSLGFTDGSKATESAVIACDGIKSVIRASYILATVSNSLMYRPVFANEFAYRGMLPRAQFLEITRGMIDLAKGTVFCGHNTYVVTR